MNNAYIVDGVRTAIGNLSGGLSEVRADDLAAHAIARLVARHPTLDPAEVTDVILGCANQAGEDNRNVARMAVLLAGMPDSVPGVTLNRLCASGLAAVTAACHAVRAGDGVGEAREQHRHPCDVAIVLARLVRAAQVDVLDLRGRDAGPLHRGGDRVRREVVRADGLTGSCHDS